jgi:hypothetical protein
MKQRIFGIVALVLFFLPAGMKGQAYRMELGLLGGNSFYMGDANAYKPLLNGEPAIGFIGRYNINGSMSLKANVLSAGVYGTTKADAGGYYNGEELQFNRRLVDANLQYELGFYHYGVPGYKPGSSSICPYLSAGIGLTGYRSDKVRVCPTIPFGLGVKAKLMSRLNVGCEWSFRMTLADDLDYSDKTTTFQLDNDWAGSGSWNKNKDWYSVLMLYVTLDLYGTGSDCYK